jgi:hypothetical protein
VSALDMTAVIVANLVVIIEKVNNKCIEIGRWQNVKDEG